MRLPKLLLCPRAFEGVLHQIVRSLAAAGEGAGIAAQPWNMLFDRWGM